MGFKDGPERTREEKNERRNWRGRRKGRCSMVRRETGRTSREEVWKVSKKGKE